MSKTPVAFAAALLAAATLFTSTAEAGFGIHLGFGGPLPSFFAHGNSGGGYASRHCKRRTYVETRTVTKKVHVAAKKAEPTEKVAKVETPEVAAELPVAEPITTAETENSSITTAAIDPNLVKSPETPATPVTAEPVKTPLTVKPAAEASEPKPEKTASKLDCKKFFPSVGMTLTVPCE